MDGRPLGRWRSRLLLAVAGLHLGVVAAGALEVDFQGGGPLKRAVARYAALSGAEAAYSFFAPGVGTQLRAIFEITDAAGNTSTDVLQPGTNPEAELRFGNMNYIFWLEDEDLRRAFAASWAGKMLARHPEAQSVAVRVEAYELPSMAEYREGRETGWSLHYGARFVRRSREEQP